MPKLSPTNTVSNIDVTENTINHAYNEVRTLLENSVDRKILIFTKDENSEPRQVINYDN